MISKYAGRRFWSLLLISFGLIVLNSRGAELLQWEGDNGQVLFTVKDIVRFDWERQVFELKREPSMDLWAYTDNVLERKFVVRDEVGMIYEGQFVSSHSSRSYEGPVMLIGYAPVFDIRAGYAAPRREGEDKRFSPRLREDLEKAGVLKPATTNEQVDRILYTFGGWAGDKGRIGLGMFPKTFRIGETARIHILFREIEVEADSVQVETTLSQEGGFFSTTIQKFGAIHTNGIHIVRWNPWTAHGVKGKAQPGPVSLVVKVEMRKKTPQGEVSVVSVELPEPGVPEIVILPSVSESKKAD